MWYLEGQYVFAMELVYTLAHLEGIKIALLGVLVHTLHTSAVVPNTAVNARKIDEYDDHT